MTDTTSRRPIRHADPDDLLALIRRLVIGDDEAFMGPFGIRRLTYADYTASGRNLSFIEDYIREQVMPLYANTHTESSGTGLQTTRFREDARDIIRDACSADRDEYAVIFAGSGSTAAVDKLIGILNIRLPADLDRRYDLVRHIPAEERPVVFIGPYEHHSNELLWRERHGTRYQRHHNYMVALLIDLFGIQSRGGCSCAGPYGHRLLGIDIETSHEFEREITRGCEGIKPGWVRVNFNYFIDEPVFEYVLQAVELIAANGWRLLPHYRHDPAAGLWHHVGREAEAPLGLHDIVYTAGGMAYEQHRRQEPESALAGYLAEARALMADPPEPIDPPQCVADLDVGADFEGLRWFLLPDEAAEELTNPH